MLRKTAVLFIKTTVTAVCSLLGYWVVGTRALQQISTSLTAEGSDLSIKRLQLC